MRLCEPSGDTHVWAYVQKCVYLCSTPVGLCAEVCVPMQHTCGLMYRSVCTYAAHLWAYVQKCVYLCSTPVGLFTEVCVPMQHTLALPLSCGERLPTPVGLFERHSCGLV